MRTLLMIIPAFLFNYAILGLVKSYISDNFFIGALTGMLIVTVDFIWYHIFDNHF